MKKLVLCLFISGFLSYAYSQKRPWLDVGLRVSKDISLDISSAFKSNTLGSFYGGGYVASNLPLGLGAQIDFLVQVRDIDFSGDFYKKLEDYAISRDETLNFDRGEIIQEVNLAVPILFHYSFFRFFSLELGPQFKFYLNSDDYKMGTESINRFFQVQAIAGLKVSLLNFSFYLRYLQDITNSTPDNLKSVLGASSQGGVQLGLGYSFFSF